MSKELKSVQDCANRLIKIMETGTNPWVKPWKESGNIHNPVSKKPFTGFNRFYLSIISSQFSCGFFVTYAQAAGAGGNVKKGEKGFPVLMPLIMTKENSKGEKESFCKGFKEYYVFNLDQCENMQNFYEKSSEKPIDRIESCEKTLMKSGANFVQIDKNSCYYSSKNDYINMVNINNFHNSEGYYATAFHELSHWTGHESRLDRKLGNTFGNSDYAFEELIAELSANALCQYHGIDGVDSHNAAYLKSWIQALHNDPSVILKAASQAQKAFDYIIKASEQCFNPSGTYPEGFCYYHDVYIEDHQTFSKRF